MCLHARAGVSAGAGACAVRLNFAARKVSSLAPQREFRGGAGRGLREAREAASQQGPGGAAERAAVTTVSSAPRKRSHVAETGLWPRCAVLLHCLVRSTSLEDLIEGRSGLGSDLALCLAARQL